MTFDSDVFNKVVTAGIVGLLGWLLVQTQDISVNQAVAATELKNLRESVQTMQTTYLTRVEADTRMSAMEENLNRMRDALRQHLVAVAKEPEHVDATDN